MEYANAPHQVRDLVPVQEPGQDWHPMEHLGNWAYADYLLKWGQVCYVSEEWLADRFPEFDGIYDFRMWGPDQWVWILESRGPDVLVGATFLQRPVWVWSKLVNITTEWALPRTNIFIHENEPQRGP